MINKNLYKVYPVQEPSSIFNKLQKNSFYGAFNNNSNSINFKDTMIASNKAIFKTLKTNFDVISDDLINYLVKSPYVVSALSLPDDIDLLIKSAKINPEILNQLTDIQIKEIKSNDKLKFELQLIGGKF